MTTFDIALPGESAPPSRWLDLDRAVRDALRFGRAVPLGPVGPVDAAARGLAAALCHPSGPEREAALTRVPAAPPEVRADVLPLVAVRCADWAEPVRERALEVLREALGRPLPPHVLTATAGLVLAAGGRSPCWRRRWEPSTRCRSGRCSPRRTRRRAGSPTAGRARTGG
ncbi:hypothetical protein [Streptomyces sp. NPDC047981]|uniref:hypothetical protein n=1 Tax=Streptomyces sp. NPDC047981 TaxID=3154610 RepID=UPI003445DD07